MPRLTFLFDGLPILAWGWILKQPITDILAPEAWRTIPFLMLCWYVLTCHARILPEMSLDEALKVTKICSAAGQFPAGRPRIRHRPFRAPHHTTSHAGLVDGGNIPKPGEIFPAQRGVLFLVELPESGSRVLEGLRQPLEDKVVAISRAKGSRPFPPFFSCRLE